MTDTQAKRPFEGYRYESSTFWVRGTGLTVTRHWSRRPYVDPDAGDRFWTLITGKAICIRADDSVTVIGKEDRRTKEFALTIKSDLYTTQEWKRHMEIQELLNENDGTTPEVRLRAYIFDSLTPDPPTAELSYFQGWSITCAVPPSLLAQLEAELLVQRAREVDLQIEWVCALSSGFTTWGLFTIGENEYPEPMYGHVMSIRWQVSNEKPALNQMVGREHEENPETQIDHLNRILAGHMLVLARRCAIGFFLAIAAVLVGYFLR